MQLSDTIREASGRILRRMRLLVSIHGYGTGGCAVWENKFLKCFWLVSTSPSRLGGGVFKR